ncbi:MAG: MarR family transcriptional regulator [Chlamydiales bacterium]
MKAEWEKITEFDGPEESPGFLLWQVSTMWRREIEEGLVTLQLTHPQFVLLANLGWMTKDGSKVSQVELARRCKTDINMTSSVLRTLEKKGLIERIQLEGNLRSKFPLLTKGGEKIIMLAIPLVEEIDRKFFSKIGKKQNTFISFMRSLSKKNVDS